MKYLHETQRSLDQVVVI